ncbi:36091_t:CDS:2, partial [Gigaspora margarita]
INKCELHLKVCSNFDNESYQAYFGTPKVISSQVALHLSANIQKKTLQNMNIKNFFDHITTNKQDNLELNFAEAIKKIKPSFKLPTRKKMAGQLLETIYNNTKLKVDKNIEDTKYLTLICNSW